MDEPLDSTQFPNLQEWSSDPVAALRVVVHSTSALTTIGSRRPNHWSIYLLRPAQAGGDSSDASVRLNMQHAGELMTDMGRFTAAKKTYSMPHSALRFWDIPIVREQPLTAGAVVQTVVANGRDQFMTVHGAGCRHWVYVF